MHVGRRRGTVIFTPAHDHLGRWTIKSATAGIQEALQAGGPGAQVVIDPGIHPIHAQIQPPFDGVVLSGAGHHSTTILEATGANLDNMLLLQGRNRFMIDSIAWDANFVNQTSGIGHGVQVYMSSNILVQDCRFTHAGMGFPGQSASYALLIHASSHLRVVRNQFESNWGRDFACIGERTRALYTGLYVADNQFGAADLGASNSNINWWDTNSAGHYSLGISGVSGVTVRGNRIYGAVKKPFLGNPLQLTDVNNAIVSDNVVEGLGNGSGALSVMRGSTKVMGVNTFFKSGAPTGSDINSVLMVEGDPTLYRITAVASAARIRVTPAVTRTTATGLRYRISSTGDAISVAGCDDVIVRGNAVRFSHDGGIDVGSDSAGVHGTNYVVAGNTSMFNIGFGLYAAGLQEATISGNSLMNNGQAGAVVPASHRAGLYIENSSTDLAVINSIIAENTVSDTQRNPTQQYGLSIQGSVGSGNTVGLNQFAGNHKGAVFMASGRGFHRLLRSERRKIKHAFTESKSVSASAQ